MPTKLTREILTAALAGFRLDQQRIASQIAEVEALLKDFAGGNASASDDSPSSPKSKRGRGKRSPAARKRMAEAQRARWAKVKGDSAAAALEPSTKRKNKKSKASLRKKAGKKASGKPLTTALASNRE
jgi:hypothetical protein